MAGKPIQAHGGGILWDDGTYYWYGEDKDADNGFFDGVVQERHDVIGVHCYSSTDLVHWEDVGVVLSSVPTNPSHDLFPGNVLERPKVVRCQATGQYVMYAHVDSADYGKASLGVAVSDHPTGPFEYRHSFRPGGHDSRDMTLFQDDDGSTYVFFSSESAAPQSGPGYARHKHWNATQRIAKLTEDGLLTAGEPVVAFENEFREAPAVFKWSGRYYQITSGCTGWAPNAAAWHVADHPQGPWQTVGNPCVGDLNGTTFESQSTFVIPLPGKPNDFIFMADRWSPQHLRDSRYVWLPLSMESGEPRITWHDAWSPF